MLKGLWRKVLSGKEEQKLIPGSEFSFAMDFVRDTLVYEKTKEDKIIILNFILGLIKEDLKNDLLTTILYNKEHFDKVITNPFPFYYKDQEGRDLEITLNEEQRKAVDLAKDCVLVLAWERERLRNSIKNIFHNPFEYIRSNHLAYYFTYVDICYAYNGTHSISSGMGHKKGVIEAKVVDITPMFDHVYTDGVNWYDLHSGMKLRALWDFRIGVIYEICKIKYKLEH